MSGDRWYIYRLMPLTDGDLYQLHREAGFSSQQAASNWVFKSGDQGDRLGQTFLFRRYRYQEAPLTISLKAERAEMQRQRDEDQETTF